MKLAPMSVLSELTIICLSYERQNYVRRQLVYFSDTPVKLVVADGSDRPMADLEPSEVVNISLRFRYIHLAGAATYQKRLELALEEVDTPFVTLMDDADILFKSGLARAVLELKGNQNISVAAGKVGRFEHAEGLKQVGYSNWGHWSSPLSLEGVSQTKLLEMISNMRTANVFYVVSRRDIFIEGIQKMHQARLTNGSAGELFLTAFFIIKSNFNLGDYPFWMRGNVPSVPSKLYDKCSETEWHVVDGEDRKDFISYLAGELAESGKLERDEAVKVIEGYLSVHYKQCIYSDRRGQERISGLVKYFYSFRGLVKSRLLSNHFGVTLLGCYRRLRHGRGRAVADTIRYWESAGADLAEDQVTDLRNYDELLSRFPKGIESSADLYLALKASRLKTMPQR